MRPPPDAAGSDWRRAERRRLIALRLAMTDAERVRAGRAIEAALEARFPPGSVDVLGGYWPIQGEFDALPYLRRTLGAGGEVALPLATKRGAVLRYRRWTSETPMAAGFWDIMHPVEGPELTPTALLVPLVGFDADGHRLGYGGGFFDRTLAAWKPRPLAIGVGFEIGRLATITPRDHDQPMDAIITEAGAFPTRLARRNVP
jgi:5,10-methenyltetrahydrofolate synthetase